MEKMTLKIEQSKEKITPFGGAVLLGEMFEKLGIGEYIDSKLPKPKSNRGLKPSKKLIPLIASFMLGGSSFSDVDKILSDETLQMLLKIDKVPDSSTINRWFLNQFCYGKNESVAKSKEIETVGNLLTSISMKLLKIEGLKEVTIDQDATYIKANKSEASKCYKGYKAYSSLMSFIAGVGCCISEESRKGNISPATGLLDQLILCNSELDKQGVKLSRYRGDSASYNHEIINYCFEEGIEFFIGGTLDSAVLNGIGEIDEESWEARVDRYGVKSDTEEVSEFIHSMNKTKESFRMIVVKEELKEQDSGQVLFKEYKYRVIATNSELPANEVVNYYNERGICEYYIKEAKYGFNLKNLPSDNLESNGLWVKVGMLSYNLMLLLKRYVLESGTNKIQLRNKIKKCSYKNKESKSIRYLIFSIAGKIVKRSRNIILKLCCPQEMIELFHNSRLKIMELKL